MLKSGVPDGASAVTVTNLMEHPEGDPLPVSDGHVTVPVGKYSINTVRIDYSNRGAAFWQAQK